MTLRQWLSENGLTITDLAVRVGCTRPCASAWVAGKARPSPRHTATIKIITLGKVTADDLQRAWEMAR